jgi:hypothetical protein
VVRVLLKGEMSLNHCRKILKFFSLNFSSGNKNNKFVLKGRKLKNVLEEGTMFSRTVTAFTEEISIPLFIGLFWNFKFSPLYKSKQISIARCLLLLKNAKSTLSKHSHGIQGDWTSVPTWGLIVQ